MIKLLIILLIIINPLLPETSVLNGVKLRSLGLSKTYVSELSFPTLFHDEIIPLGFSKKGIFAYLYKSHVYDGGGIKYNFHILNLIYDREIFRLEGEASSPPPTLESYLSQKKNLILKELSKHDIQLLGDTIQGNKFPFDYKYDHVDMEIIPEKNKYYSLYVDSLRLGQKKLTSVQSEFSVPEKGLALLSPFEDRAVFMSLIIQKLHADEYTKKLLLFGGHFSKSFGKYPELKNEVFWEIEFCRDSELLECSLNPEFSQEQFLKIRSRKRLDKKITAVLFNKKETHIKKTVECSFGKKQKTFSVMLQKTQFQKTGDWTVELYEGKEKFLSKDFAIRKK